MSEEAPDGRREPEVPHSAGTSKPALKAPDSACDSHLHIIDPRFAPADDNRQRMTAGDYILLQRRIGTTRAVVVQAKQYGVDNACLLDALRQLGANGRGVAVVGADVSDEELERLHAGGVRGLRFSLWNPAENVVSLDMIARIAARIAPLGWHVQVHMMADQIADAKPLLQRLPCPLVIDHMGRLPPEEGERHPAFKDMADLLAAGNCWVKLAGAYLNTTEGPPHYADATRVAQALVRMAPERLVWGSDWPHITEAHKPDDSRLFDLLLTWAGDEATRRAILVDNPARLYQFA